MIKNILTIIILSIIINSCSPLKRLKTVTQGNVEQKNYLEVIPFKYINNTIILTVKISEKEYDFVFDTGNDLTSIDDDLLTEILIKSNKVSNDIADAKNVISNNEYVSVNDIKLGNILFSNIGAQVFDHSPFEQVFGCDLKISGFIGSNLMRKAKWQIDYKNRVIRISDKIESFNLGNDNQTFKTNSGNYGDAKIEIQLNNIIDSYTFDTGSSSFISTDLKILEKLKSENNIQTTKAIISSFTASGLSLTESTSGLIENIKIKNISIQNQIVNFSKNHSNLIGNQYFENYLVTLDWEKELFYLKPITKIKPASLESYEYTFAPNYKTNTISFYNAWTDHNLKEQIDLSSKILTINGITLENFTNQEFCEFWEMNKEKLLTKKVELEILEKGVKRKIYLTKKLLLPK